MSPARIPTTFRRSRRARRLRLTVYPGGRCVVTLPWRCSLHQAELFVASRAQWLERTAARLSAVPARAPQRLWSAAERRAALRVFQEKVAAWNHHYGFRVQGVRVRDMRSRWGSCSPTGVLTLNLRLAVVPQALQDYVVVHELCHVQQSNHSAAFWALVARTMPAHRALRRQLRTLYHL